MTVAICRNRDKPSHNLNNFMEKKGFLWGEPCLGKLFKGSPLLAKFVFCELFWPNAPLYLLFFFCEKLVLSFNYSSWTWVRPLETRPRVPWWLLFASENIDFGDMTYNKMKKYGRITKYWTHFKIQKTLGGYIQKNKIKFNG